jgi:ADP-heptose:LPS heptosyltransferase
LILDAGQAVVDFADLATALNQLDLVVSVDAATAHLAGALGKPVWTLLPAVGDWHWPASGDKTPWYPSMRLFRQKTRGDWTEVMAEVMAALQRARRARATAR